MAANFPNSPNTNDTFTSNGVTFEWNGTAWKLPASPGVKGSKGEPGDKGQKGEKGEKGDKGDKGQKGEDGNKGDKGEKGQKGDKGQKGEVGASGGAGTKGQKGEKGEKGDKGEKGQKGQDGNDATGTKGQKGEVGQKGQKGEDNSTKGQKGEDGSATKGQKGEVGADNSTKGQKGEPGADNSTKGQKGEIGVGNKGQKGEVGADNSTKGQKGEAGSVTAAIPSGGIIIWSGASNAIPSGWYLCDGNNSTPDLRSRFVVGAGPGGLYSVGDTGGSRDAVLVSHTHNLQNHVHGINLTTNDPGGHTHGIPRGSGGSQASVQNYVPSPRVESVQSPFNTTSGGSHTHTVSGNTGTPSTNTTDTLGESATNKNLPPYYALCYIMKS